MDRLFLCLAECRTAGQVGAIAIKPSSASLQNTSTRYSRMRAIFLYHFVKLFGLIRLDVTAAILEIKHQRFAFTPIGAMRSLTAFPLES